MACVLRVIDLATRRLPTLQLTAWLFKDPARGELDWRYPESPGPTPHLK